MSKSEQDTIWFIYTGGNHLADQMIADTDKLGPEDECLEVLCADRHKRDMWRCPDYEFVRIFEEAAKQIAPVPYKIYRRQGQYGEVQERWFGLRHHKIKALTA
jgi:hypothetical protein